MKKVLLCAAFIAASFTSIAQVGVGTTIPDDSAALDITSTTAGLLPPRMTTAERDLINSGVWAEGLTIYNTDTKCLELYNGTDWISVCDGSVVTTPNPLAMSYIKPPFLDSNDQFGKWSVISDDGNTIAVVSRNDASSAAGIFYPPLNASNAGDNSLANAGSVYVFSRANNTVDFAVEAYIKNANPTTNDVFGFRGLLMSGDGNTLVVGSVKGVAYIFTRSGTTWTERQSVTKNNGSGDRFTASAISQDGTTIAFGAEKADSSAVGIDPTGDGSDDSLGDTGEVFIYVRSGNTWSQQAYIKPSQVKASDEFTALTLSPDGDILIAKSGGYDTTTVTDGGAIFVFSRDNAGLWTESQIIQTPNVSTNDGDDILTSLSDDGSTLAIAVRLEGSGTDAIISASGTIPTDETAPNSGAVYIYNYNGSQFVFETYIKAPNAEASDYFGQHVALTADGNKLFVSSLGDDSDANGIFLSGDSGYAAALADNSATSEAGAVHVFKRSAGIWTAAAFIKAENSDGSDRFSNINVTSNGNTLIVGAVGEQSNSTTIGEGQSDNSITNKAGAVYVIDVSGI